VASNYIVVITSLAALAALARSSVFDGRRPEVHIKKPGNTLDMIVWVARKNLGHMC